MKIKIAKHSTSMSLLSSFVLPAISRFMHLILFSHQEAKNTSARTLTIYKTCTNSPMHSFQKSFWQKANVFPFLCVGNSSCQSTLSWQVYHQPKRHFTQSDVRMLRILLITPSSWQIVMRKRPEITYLTKPFKPHHSHDIGKQAWFLVIFMKVKFTVRVKEAKTHIGRKEAMAGKEQKISGKMMLGSTRLKCTG